MSLNELLNPNAANAQWAQVYCNTLTASNIVGPVTANDVKLASAPHFVDLVATSSPALTAPVTATFAMQNQSDTVVLANATQVLTNKKIDDASTTVVGTSDLVGSGKFSVGGVTASQTRTMSFPDLDGVIATEQGTQELKNKTLDAATCVFGSATSRAIGFDLSGSLNNTKVTVITNATANQSIGLQDQKTGGSFITSTPTASQQAIVSNVNVTGAITATSSVKGSSVKLIDVSTPAHTLALASNSSVALTADRTLTVDTHNASPTLELAGSLMVQGADVKFTGSNITLAAPLGPSVVSIPAVTDTMAVTGAVQTLQNKTLTSDTTFFLDTVAGNKNLHFIQTQQLAGTELDIAFVSTLGNATLTVPDPHGVGVSFVIAESGALNHVTQITSISTDVTANFHAGVITTVSATTTYPNVDEFKVINSYVSTDSVILISLQSYSNSATAGIPTIFTGSIANGSFHILIRNGDAANPLNAPLVISFAVLS